MYNKIKKLYKIIENIEKMIVGALFIFLCIVTFYTIVNRAIGGTGLPWLTEVSKSVVIITTYFCGCVAIGEDRLTKLSLVTDAIPKKYSYLLKAITSLISGIFMVWLGYVCVKNIATLKVVGMMQVTLNIPSYLLYIPLAVGMFGMALRFLLMCYECLKMFKETDVTVSKMTTDEKVQELMEKGK